MMSKMALGKKNYHHNWGTPSSCMFRVDLCLSSRDFAQPYAFITMLSVKWKNKNCRHKILMGYMSDL